MKPILFIDNQDSFTLNVVAWLHTAGLDCEIIQADAPDPKWEPQRWSGLVVGPGPGHPADASRSLTAIDHLAPHLPVLGICMGHQCLALWAGGDVLPSARIMHGKRSELAHHAQGLFEGIPQGMQVMRYHSWSVASALPKGWQVAATCREDGEVMAIHHQQHPWWGLQFHPESIASLEGSLLAKAWVERVIKRNCSPCSRS